MKVVKDWASKVTKVQLVVSTIIMIMPLLGHNLTSLSNWSSKVYNLAEELDSKQNKQDQLEVLLYIEEAILDDVVADKLLINDINSDTELKVLAKQELLEAHYSSYNEKILKLERIRQRIKLLDPTWKSRDEKEKEQ